MATAAPTSRAVHRSSGRVYPPDGSEGGFGYDIWDMSDGLDAPWRITISNLWHWYFDTAEDADLFLVDIEMGRFNFRDMDRYPEARRKHGRLPY